jgi:hypothetical protein
MANLMRCVSPYYYVLTRETIDEGINQQLEAFKHDFVRKTVGHSQILPETMNETKITELMDHIRQGVIGRGQIQPTFIQSSCRNSNIVIYLQRNDNPGRLPELIKTLGFLTAKVRDNNTLELELIATSLIYKGCGSTLMNTFLQSARDSGFESLYLYSLLSPLPFYQNLGLTYLGHTRGDTNAKRKDYMIMNLQTNDIKDFDIRKIIFDPPRPGTQIETVPHDKFLEFMGKNKPYENVQPEHLSRVRSMSRFRKTTNNGKKYLNQNAYQAYLLSRKRSHSRNRSRSHARSHSRNREAAEEPKGRKRFKIAVRKVLNKIKSQKRSN